MSHEMNRHADIVESLIADERTAKAVVEVLDKLKIDVFRANTVAGAFEALCVAKAEWLDRARNARNQANAIVSYTDKRVCGVCDCVRDAESVEQRDEFGIRWACVDGCTDMLDQEREDENGRDAVNF